MSKKKKTELELQAIAIQHAALKSQYEFARNKCGHHVTAQTVATALGLPKYTVCNVYRRGGGIEKMEAITTEYTRQIAEFVKGKGYEFAVLAAAQMSK
jgi:hypothetical protein